MAPKFAYIHRFEPGADPSRPLVLLLHGTGGDETDLLPIGREIAPGAALLSPRGNVLEGDMPRFFRRIREGLFDEDDVRRRAGQLADFVAEARRAYGLAQPLALGYSNGANIAAAVLLLHPKTLAGAILLRAMAPLAEPPRPDLSGVPVLILSGLSDPIATRATAEKLAAALAAAGARVEREQLPAGHGLTQADVAKAKAFYAREAARSLRSEA
ncbi:MAG TPA: alpha/beta hydrolase [Roseiarcus sp.]|nr:alpha/beta hydrolase [Roseiarcus sp.]